MKYSISWLSRFCEITADLPMLCAQTTERSAEIDGVERQGEGLEKIVIGKVESIAPHPDADKLRVCRVSVGENEPIQVVCGGTNVAAGQKVAVAMLGARVRWHGEGEPVEMKLTKIRGVESAGMICASDEIGLSEIFPHEKGEIVDLSDCVSVDAGTPLAEALGLTDTILEVENTSITNRPDLFSHLGFAREFAANGCARGFLEPQFSPIVEANVPFPLEVKITDPSLCPVYRAVALDSVSGSQPSPKWLADLLSAVGIRPISLLVDITNFVMFDLGVPLHAFDLDAIVGRRVTMRESRVDEVVRTLDGIDRTPPAGTIVLEDEKGVFDLCGIMGAERSGCTKSTTRIWLHAPIYDPLRIRKSASALNHRTDASTVYEKSVPSAMADLALQKAVALLVDLGGARVASRVVAFGEPKLPEPIVLRKALLEMVLGRSFDRAAVEAALSPLGFSIVAETAEAWTIAVPVWRVRDITIPEDLIEEVARISGLSLIEPQMPRAEIALPQEDRVQTLRKKWSDFLVAMGAFEAVNYAFLSDDLLRSSAMETDATVRLQNPISSDLAVMRPSLLPYLLKNASQSQKFDSSIRFFEIGAIFSAGLPRPSEKTAFASVCANGDFASEKGIVEALFSIAGVSIEICPGQTIPPYAHPSRAAEISAHGRCVGGFGQLHPTVAKAFSLPEATSFFEIDFEFLASIPQKTAKFQALARFPGSTRDQNIVVPHRTLVAEILRRAKNVSPLLVSISAIDVFSLGDAEKSVTISALYRAADRTLTDAEVDSAHAVVVSKIIGSDWRVR